MPRKPQPPATATITLPIPKPLLKYLEKRAMRQFTTVEDEIKRILVTVMHADPIERELQKSAERRAKAVVRAPVHAQHTEEIHEAEIAEAQLLVHQYPPTTVHGKSSLKLKGVEVYNSKFKAVFMLAGKRRMLGVFNTAIEAARAVDDIARKVYGKRAFLNFPNHGELSAKSGKLRIMRNGVETWEPAPEHTTFRLPKPIPGLPSLTYALVPDGKGNFVDPPGKLEVIQQQRHAMFLAAMQEDAIVVGGEVPPPSDPHEDEEEERRLRRLAAEEPPEPVQTSTDEDSGAH